jgi:hypothetical protein
LETAHGLSHYNFEERKQMTKKKKGKKIIPTVIPIIWVNIVETSNDGTVLL